MNQDDEVYQKIVRVISLLERGMEILGDPKESGKLIKMGDLGEKLLQRLKSGEQDYIGELENAVRKAWVAGREIESEYRLDKEEREDLM